MDTVDELEELLLLWSKSADELEELLLLWSKSSIDPSSPSLTLGPACNFSFDLRNHTY